MASPLLSNPRMRSRFRPSLVLFVLAVFLSAAASADAAPLYALCGAYPPETDALMKIFAVDTAHGWTKTEIDGVTFWKGSSDGKDVLIFQTGVSMVNASYRLQIALDHFPVTGILFSGVAGGTDPDLQVGDVVIPQTWAYHGESAYLNDDGKGGYVRPDYLPPGKENFGMMFPTGVEVQRSGDGDVERIEEFPADASYLAAAKRALPGLPPMSKLGRPISVQVGGTGVTATVFLDNAKYREWIYRVWKAKCTDMESTALAHVAYANHKPILIIRGLSDLAGGQHGKNPINQTEYSVSEIAARVLKSVLDQI